MKPKKILKFLKKHYFLTIIFLCLAFVGIVIVKRTFYSKPTYVYVKVKVGQGLWWASTVRPSIWYVNAINKGDSASDFLGNSIARIISKRYYRYYGTDQYDIYLIMSLKVGVDRKTNEFTFNRSVLSVGTPIDIPFPNVDIIGTVIDLSKNPFGEKLVEKTITITEKYAYPWEYDAIQLGDSYFDGENKIFEITDKHTQDFIGTLSFNGQYAGSLVSEPSNYLTVKAKVKMKQVGNQWILGEDQLIVPGRNISISTPNFVFSNYVVTKIE